MVDTGDAGDPCCSSGEAFNSRDSAEDSTFHERSEERLGEHSGSLEGTFSGKWGFNSCARSQVVNHQAERCGDGAC